MSEVLLTNEADRVPEGCESTGIGGSRRSFVTAAELAGAVIEAEDWWLSMCGRWSVSGVIKDLFTRRS